MKIALPLSLLVVPATASMASNFAQNRPSNGVGLRALAKSGSAKEGKKKEGKHRTHHTRPGHVEPISEPVTEPDLGGLIAKSGTLTSEGGVSTEAAPSSIPSSGEKGKEKHHVKKVHPKKLKYLRPSSTGDKAQESISVGDKMKPLKETKSKTDKKAPPPDLGRFVGPPKKEDDSGCGPPEDSATDATVWEPTPSPSAMAAVSTEEPTTDSPTTQAPTTSEPVADTIDVEAVIFNPVGPMVNDTESMPVYTQVYEAESVITPCPDPYDENRINYIAGDTIEMDSHIFECQPLPLEEFCNIAVIDPSWNETVQDMWLNAWSHISVCVIEETVYASVEATAPITTATPEDPIATTTTETPLTTTTILATTTTETPITTTIMATTTTETPSTTTITATTTSETPSTTTVMAMTTTETPIASIIMATTTTEDPQGGNNNNNNNNNSNNNNNNSPTPTLYPSYYPTEMHPCEPPYDPDTTYEEGDIIEHSGHNFMCESAKYCNIEVWDDDLPEEYSEQEWHDAWAHLSQCEANTVEELMDQEALDG